MTEDLLMLLKNGEAHLQAEAMILSITELAELNQSRQLWDTRCSSATVRLVITQIFVRNAVFLPSPRKRAADYSLGWSGAKPRAIPGFYQIQ